MGIATRTISYGDDGTPFEAFMAWDDSQTRPVPGVLISHTIRGRTPFEESKAIALAKMGYVGFALDVYGRSEIGGTDEASRANMLALQANREELQRRLMLSLSCLSEQREVDAARQAAMGYCFGGMCVLDLARIGAPVAGVASFHGIFAAPGNTVDKTIAAKVLALHGWDDPLATPAHVKEFSEEMTSMGADWQLHAYGNTAHAFTNPAANDSAKGTVYHASADRRSWQALQNFLNELFE